MYIRKKGDFDALLSAIPLLHITTWDQRNGPTMLSVPLKLRDKNHLSLWLLCSNLKDTEVIEEHRVTFLIPQLPQTELTLKQTQRVNSHWNLHWNRHTDSITVKQTELRLKLTHTDWTRTAMDTDWTHIEKDTWTELTLKQTHRLNHSETDWTQTEKNTHRLLYLCIRWFFYLKKDMYTYQVQCFSNLPQKTN